MSGGRINFGSANAPAKSGGKSPVVFLFLFALPFAGFGVFALVQALRQFGAGKTREAIALMLFGLIFSGVGFGLMFGAVWARKKVKQDDEQQVRNPDKPWFWRADWAEGRVKSTNKQAALFLWGFALFWNAISSFTIIFLPQELHKGNHAAWIGMIFPLVGAGLIVAAVRATLVWRRFGQCIFEMAAIPGAVDGTLEGMIQVGARLRAEHGLHLKLSCIRRTVSGSGDDRSTQESILWQDEKVFKREAVLPEPEPGRTGIPVYFKIPADQPECSTQGNDSVLWRLEATARVAGPDFSATFEVPVFKVTGAAITADEVDPTAALQMPLDEVRRDENSRIKVADGPHGREFHFPAARNLGVAFSITFMFLIFGGFTVAARLLFHSLFFEIVFGLVSLLVLIGCINLWLKSSRVTINSSGVTARNRWLIFSRTRQFDANEIDRFATRITMTSGNRAYHAIKLVTRASEDNFAARKARYQQTGERFPMKFGVRDPSGATLASGIASKLEADWLVREMTAALGRRI